MGDFDNGTMEINETNLANVAKKIYHLYGISSFAECMRIFKNLESQEESNCFHMSERSKTKLEFLKKNMPVILQYRNTLGLMAIPLDRINEIYNNACQEAMKEAKEKEER